MLYNYTYPRLQPQCSITVHHINSSQHILTHPPNRLSFSLQPPSSSPRFHLHPPLFILCQHRSNVQERSGLHFLLRSAHVETPHTDLPAVGSSHVTNGQQHRGMENHASGASGCSRCFCESHITPPLLLLLLLQSLHNTTYYHLTDSVTPHHSIHHIYGKCSLSVL